MNPAKPAIIMRRAANVIFADARCIKECSTFKGKWDRESDKAEYDRLMQLARDLRRAAKDIS